MGSSQPYQPNDSRSLEGLFIFINRVKNFFKNVIIAANLCNNNFLCKYIGINTESILFEFTYGIKKFKLE